MEYWVVGKVTNTGRDTWEFSGVFDEESKAVAACRSALYFVGPATLNSQLPDESVAWEGAYYPNSPTYWRVGDIVSRDGSDEHEITAIDAGLIEVTCIKAPSEPWIEVGEHEANLTRRYHFVRRGRADKDQ